MKSDQPQPTETWAEEVSRLQREIADRQARLQFLICGDPQKCVGLPVDPEVHVPEQFRHDNWSGL